MTDIKKSSRDRQYEYMSNFTPFSEMCANCVYFVQHYVRWSRDVYSPIDDGHCRGGRLKRCRTYDLCGKFVNRYYDDPPK